MTSKVCQFDISPYLGGEEPNCLNLKSASATRIFIRENVRVLAFEGAQMSQKDNPLFYLFGWKMSIHFCHVCGKEVDSSWETCPSCEAVMPTRGNMPSGAAEADSKMPIIRMTLAYNFCSSCGVKFVSSRDGSCNRCRCQVPPMFDISAKADIKPASPSGSKSRFCTNCGEPAEGNFCGNCGSQLLK